MHRRAVGSSAASPIADTVTSDTNVLREAINLVQVVFATLFKTNFSSLFYHPELSGNANQ
jgi:hypothetical protein